MRVRVTCVSLVLTIVAAPRLSNAQERRLQEQNPASIPTELALALLEGAEFGSGRQPRIVVGHAPEGMLESVMSFEGGTVIGGLTSERNAIVIFAFTLPPNQVVLSLDRQLLARGWTPPPSPESTRGGFVSSAYVSAFGNVYCRDSMPLFVTSLPAPAGGTYLKLAQRRDRDFVCRPREGERFSAVEFKYPVLLVPPGMSSHSSGSSSGGGSSSINTRLTGPLKPAEALAHYRAQLDAAGWLTRSPGTSGADAAIAYVEAPDSTKVVWRGMLTAVQIAPSEVEVEIQMRRSRER